MKIYFIGICGTAMGNVAILMKKLGHNVCGSDTAMYDPIKSALENAKISAHEGFDCDDLENFEPDIVVVGNSVSRMNPQLEFVLRSKKYKYTSLPELIGSELIAQRDCIVVSGTHGKTTTSTICAYLLKHNNVDAGWLIGGIPIDLPEGGCQLGNINAPFAIEGDEYDSAFFDKRSKFLHYKPKVLIINNIEFDHADIFRDIIDVKRTFTHLRRIVAPDGIIIENADDQNISSLENTPWTKSIKVGLNASSDIVISNFSQSKTHSSFTLTCKNIQKHIKWKMQGIYNAYNLTMAITAVSMVLNKDNPLDLNLDSIENFNGVKRRQEILFENDNFSVIEDFAHHPSAIALTINSFRQKFPDSKIYACFEPRSNTAKRKVLQDDFTQALLNADNVYIGKANTNNLENPIDTFQMAKDNPRKIKAYLSNKELLDELFEDFSKDESKKVCIFFSNGSFDNIHKDFALRASEI